MSIGLTCGRFCALVDSAPLLCLPADFIMRDQSSVIAVHRAWRIEQRSQQILPDVPNPRCVLLQAVRDETDMLAVQLQQLRPHDLGWIIVACNADSAARAANCLLHQVDDFVKLLPVNVRITCQNVVVNILQDQVPVAFKRFLRFRSLLRGSVRKTGRERNRIGN